MTERLAALQALLSGVIRQPGLRVDDVEAEALVAATDRLSAREQLGVYREQFWLRHAEALREDFASVAHALGADAFATLVEHYVARRPPASFDLRDLGGGLPELLAREAPWAADPFLADLARLEWAFVEVFDGPDAPPLDLATLTGIAADAWPAARIVFHPSLRRLDLTFPSVAYRAAVREGGDPIRPEPARTHMIVHRGRDGIEATAIAPAAAALLAELAGGVPLGHACERAADTSGALRAAFEHELAAWFATWTSRGWVRAIAL